MKPTFSVGILTVSDRASQGLAVDKSGPGLKELLEQVEHGWHVVKCAIVPDDTSAIQSHVKEWCESPCSVQLLLITGGTGFGVRDVTPEAMRPLLDKEALGLSIAMIQASLAITPLAALSRPVCGVIKSTLIITLPGSPRGSRENISAILPILPHALDLISGSSGEQLHSSISSHRHRTHHTCGKSDRTADHPGTPDALCLPVAQRSRKSPFVMMALDEAIRIMQHHVSKQPLIVIEKNIDSNCMGYVVAESIFSPVNVPATSTSSVDGYAVVAEDGAGDYPVVSHIHAGMEGCFELERGEIVRITTGSPLPKGSNAVIMVEDTELLDASDDGNVERTVRILEKVGVGENVRDVGCDVSKGELLLEKGSIITPIGGEVGLLASCGIAKVKVYKKPIVGIVSTGNEILDLNDSRPLKHGQIRDSNRPSLMAAIRAANYDCVDLGIAKDEQVT